MNHYKLTIHRDGRPSVTFRLSYTSKGVWKRTEHLTGTPTGEEWNQMKSFQPFSEGLIDTRIVQFENLTIEKIDPKKESEKMYPKWVEAYFVFYQEQAKRKPLNWGKVQGAKLKNIIKNLTAGADGDEQKAFNTWVFLLAKENWRRQDPFLNVQIDIKQIDSNIDKLLNSFINGTATKNTAQDLFNASMSD